MKRKMIFHDMKKNPFTTIITEIFIAASAMLVSLALLLGVNLLSSVSHLMEEAKTPHFLQMHAGTLDEEERQEVEKLGGNLVEQTQILEFLNIENSEITLNETSLRDSTQDNGLCVQSTDFDYLLDLKDAVIYPKEGEIYIPVCYQKEYGLKTGDTASVLGEKFVIAGFLRDSQMNSMLASSKRFLVNEKDYEKLRESGSVEYLIEYRFKDMSDISQFESMYTDAKLPANGPAITYPLIKMLNAMSDGMMIGVILLVSILVVIIALLCIRFTLLAKLEEDKKEIGVLLALGTSLRDVKNMYLSKYLFLACVGAGIGMILTYALKGQMLSEIETSFGVVTAPGLEFLWGLLGAAVVIFIICLSVKRLLKRLEKLSVVEVVKNQETKVPKKGKKVNQCLLSKHVGISVNAMLGLKDVRMRQKLYVTNFLVFLLAMMLMIIPQNLYTTISSEKFSACMGIGESDLRFDIQKKEEGEARSKELFEALKEDERIAKEGIFLTKAFSIKTAEGSFEKLLIELGNHNMFPVVYSKGRAPKTEQEIALSSLNAKDFGVKVGDFLTVVGEHGEKELRVCGIYSDITNGGRTAKACFRDDDTPTMWSIVYATVRDKNQLAEITAEYAKQFGDIKVTDILGYMIKTYGSTIEAIQKASFLAAVLAITVTCLLTLLFARLLLAKDSYEIAILKSCGFTTRDIKRQYMISLTVASIPGMLLGIFAAQFFGEQIAGVFLSTLGADSFSFIGNPWSIYLFTPLLLLISLMIGGWFGTKQIERIPVSACVREG